MRGSRLRFVVNRTDGRTDIFSFWPSEASGEPRVLLEELDCKALSLSACASSLRVFGFVLVMKVRYSRDTNHAQSTDSNET